MIFIKKYEIKLPFKDFMFLDDYPKTKGSRRKRNIISLEKQQYGFFKYCGDNYISSELVSEKIAYEIAKVLGFPCAKIDFAKDENGIDGIINYSFADEKHQHNDAIDFLNTKTSDRREFYTLNNVLKMIYQIDKKYINNFICIMIFDALIGEQDRHEENWGFLTNNDILFSPIYDNGDCLLREFKDESFLNKYLTGTKDFDSYILHSKTAICNESHKRYNHFELIKHLKDLYPIETNTALINLKKLNDKIINKIVEKIPNYMISLNHKKLIKQYLKKRKKILLEIGGLNNG